MLLLFISLFVLLYVIIVILVVLYGAYGIKLFKIRFAWLKIYKISHFKPIFNQIGLLCLFWGNMDQFWPNFGKNDQNGHMATPFRLML